MTRANAREVYRALEKVDFMAVSDFFMTPTAELADIVLAGGHLAGDGLHRGFLETARVYPAPAESDPGGRVPVRS